MLHGFVVELKVIAILAAEFKQLCRDLLVICRDGAFERESEAVPHRFCANEISHIFNLTVCFLEQDL